MEDEQDLGCDLSKCHVQWQTHNLDFKVTIFFNIKYLENGTELYLQ